jgi:stage V sporulation protein AF
LNTPDTLSNSLSVISALILGDLAINVGGLSEQILLYMAFVAIASFTQPSYELGYAFKFLRLILLILTWLFNFWGFAAGLLLCFALLVSNKTLNGERSYLYPLIPFDGKALKRMIFRVKKQ